MEGRRRLVSIAVAMTVASVIIPATPAFGYDATVDGGVLTVTGNEFDEGVGIGCIGGNVKINGMNPATGVVSCASITSIEAALDDGADTFSLLAVTTDAFPGLTSTTIDLGEGDDVSFASEVSDDISAGGGDDLLVISDGDDSIDGGLGDDTITGDGGDFAVTDTSLTGPATGSDTLAGIEIASLAGSEDGDTLNATGFTGTAELFGDTGADTIVGGAGNDYLDDGTDEDPDSIQGSGGNDWLFAGPGDTTSGGDGRDRLDALPTGAVSVNAFSLTDGAGIIQHATMEVVAFELTGPSAVGTGFPGVLIVTGDDTDQLISGGVGPDKLSGGDGNDIIKGKAGNDDLLGQGGDDWLVGGRGRDLCKGGPGSDSLRSCE